MDTHEVKITWATRLMLAEDWPSTFRAPDNTSVLRCGTPGVDEVVLDLGDTVIFTKGIPTNYRKAK